MWKKFFNFQRMENYPAQDITICLLCKGRRFPGLIVLISFPVWHFLFPPFRLPSLDSLLCLVTASEELAARAGRRRAACCSRRLAPAVLTAPWAAGCTPGHYRKPQSGWALSPVQGRAWSRAVRWVHVLGTAVGCSQGVGFSSDLSLPGRPYAPARPREVTLRFLTPRACKPCQGRLVKVKV